MSRRQIEVEDDEPYVIIEKHQGSVGSLLIGIAVGAGLALLFAPKSGRETRAEIGTRARRVRDAAGEMVDDATEAVTDSFAQARQAVEDRIENARHALEMKKQQVARAMDAGRVAAYQAREDLERRIAETKQAYREGADRTAVTGTPVVAATRPRRATPAGRGSATVIPAPGTPGGAGGRPGRVAENAEDTE